MRLLACAIAASFVAHAVLFTELRRMPVKKEQRQNLVGMVVHETKKAPPKPLPPLPPLPEVHRVARARPKVNARSAPAAPIEPPRGFSVDSKNTVAASSVAVAAKEGGGNMFANPNDGLPAGEKLTVAPPPPPPPEPMAPPQWMTPDADRSPPYPSAALRREIEGQVMLRVCIATDGHVDSAEVVRGLGFGCDEAAMAWARQRWRFQPAHRGKTPVPTCILQPVRFQLHR